MEEETSNSVNAVQGSRCVMGPCHCVQETNVKRYHRTSPLTRWLNSRKHPVAVETVEKKIPQKKKKAVTSSLFDKGTMAAPESLGSPAASDPGRQRSPEVTVSQQEFEGCF